MFAKLFGRKEKQTEAETERYDEYEPPVLSPVEIPMTDELVRRRREEMLRKKYGATEDKSGYIL